MKKISIATKIKNRFENFLVKYPLLEKYVTKVKKNLKKIELAGTFTVSFVSLFIAYLIGFGLTKLVASFFGKKFLEINNKKSQWSAAKYTNNFNESMY